MIYILIVLLFFFAELLYFRIADKFNIIDKPNERSSHKRVTLRGGGIIFYFGVAIYFICYQFNYPWFFAGLTLITLISFIDDVRSLPSFFRLTIQFIAMGLMFYQWELFTMPWYFWLSALVVCTGIINAYNFMDGINGITGGYSLVLASALWYINAHIISFTDEKLIIILILSLLVFNFFNFRTNAKCFAGDVGATSVAFILIFMIGQLIIKTGDFSYFILLAIYGVDTVLTIIHRILLKEPLMEAHRKHMYQIMANELKLPHITVSLVYMVVQAVIIGGYFLTSNHYLYFAIVILVLITVYLLLMKKYFHLHIEETKNIKTKIKINCK